MKNIFSVFGGKEKPEDKKQVPDLPIPFGYKSAWFAVKYGDAAIIAQLLSIKNTVESNWENAFNKINRDSRYIFITPTIGNWTLIIGNWGEEQLKPMLEKLSTEFGEAQHFITHRVSEAHGWMLARNGKVIRAYAYVGDQGENIYVEGEPTDFEKQYNLVNTFSEEAKDPNYFEREDLVFPDEEFVMQIAGDWSVNPITYNDIEDLSEGVGIIGKL